MKLTLLHYVHCPFCIRVRLGLGYLGLTYESKVLPYDDEKTPIGLTGLKMLPILILDDEAINESLDILERIDQKNTLHIKELKQDKNFSEFSDLLSKLGTNIHSLAMPYWIYTPEFDESSRNYFQKKKEEKKGPFRELISKKEIYIEKLNSDLKIIESELKPFYRSQEFSAYDLLLASHLWGMYVVPEFQFSDKIHQYLQNIKKMCHFNYHEDFWKNP